MLLYVNGAGRSRAAGWSNILGEDEIFLDLKNALAMSDKVETLANASAEKHVTIIAHSAGAIPTLLALAQGAIHVSSLVLLEQPSTT